MIETTKDISITTKDVYKDVEKGVKKFLTNRDYGDGVLEFTLPLRTFDPEMNLDGIFKPIAVYKKKKKQVIISYKVPYEDVINGNKETAYRLVSIGILESIKKFEGIGVKDFDYKTFYSDVEDLFKSNNWL